MPGDRSYEPISKALRHIEPETVVMIFKGVDGQEGACPPVAYISDLIHVSSHVF